MVGGKKVLLCSEDKQIQTLEIVWIHQDLYTISEVGSGGPWRILYTITQDIIPSHYKFRVTEKKSQL